MTRSTVTAAVTCTASGIAASAVLAISSAQERREPNEPLEGRGDTSYAAVALERSFQDVFQEMSARKPEIMECQHALLEQRYDLSDRPVDGVTMSGGKPVQGGVRVRLPRGLTWQELAEMSPADMKEHGLFPEGFKPLPHPFHEEGGMVFPENHIAEVMRQEGRDLNRVDGELDLPEHLLPELPPPMYLTTRPELGDVSQGQLVTTQNFFELFNGILNPK